MKRMIRPSNFLRQVLKADALLSAATAAAMIAGASALAGATGLPQAVLLATGVALVPWVAYLLWAATRPALPAAAVWWVIALNLVWAVDCALLALGVVFEPTPAGVAFAVVQAVGVLVLAELQFVGLKCSPAVV
jgi:hypothetical protein